MVGRTFSLADSETKKANGTNHWHSVKYAITCKTNTSGNTITLNYVGWDYKVYCESDLISNAD
jgi:hypothetical protein